MFLDGLSLFFSGHSDRFDVSTFEKPSDLMHAIATGVRFDLLISDLIMKEMSGLAFVSAIRSHSQTLPILMLSGINSPPPVREIINLGANGFIHKSADNEALLRAVDALIDGDTYFPEDMPSGDEANSLGELGDGEFLDEIDYLPKLSPRQIEVLHLIANGASNRQISEQMIISENTVKSHLKSIFYEMRVNKRTACVRKARTLGLI
jgi:DNA-binding NarL/FixJ family response regulator